MDNVLAERLTFLLKKSKMNYEQVAKALGIKSKGTISKYANGQIKKIDRPMIIKIAKLFDVSPAWLLGFTDDINCTMGK